MDNFFIHPDGNHAKASASTKNLAKTNASFKLLCLLKNIKIENESDNCKTVQSVPISEKNYVWLLYFYFIFVQFILFINLFDMLI